MIISFQVTETDSSPAPSDCSKESTPIDESNEQMETIPVRIFVSSR